MSPTWIVKNAVMLCFLNVCLSYEHCEYSWRELCVYIYLNVLAWYEDKTGCIRLRSVCVVIEV